MNQDTIVNNNATLSLAKGFLQNSKYIKLNGLFFQVSFCNTSSACIYNMRYLLKNDVNAFNTDYIDYSDVMPMIESVALKAVSEETHDKLEIAYLNYLSNRSRDR